MLVVIHTDVAQVKNMDTSNTEVEFKGVASDGGTVSLERRAACLINPKSGLANDFLNHFNEVLLLVENLPILLPEMLEDLLFWEPTTYFAYFSRSKLPGRGAALAAYAAIAANTRSRFDDDVARLNGIAVEIVSEIKKHRALDGSIAPENIELYCAGASKAFRRSLDELADFINSGH